ncbi:hypothetical protein [Streptomyces sp. NPDC054887]
MKGRHSGARPQPEPSDAARPALPDVRSRDDAAPGAHEDDAGPGGFLTKLALWVGLTLCIAFVVWVAWGFLQFDQDVEHPREGGFSGWQCDAGRDCRS